jgi:hypothetical protein
MRTVVYRGAGKTDTARPDPSTLSEPLREIPIFME